MATIAAETISHIAVMTFPESDQVAAMAAPGNDDLVGFYAMNRGLLFRLAAG